MCSENKDGATKEGKRDWEGRSSGGVVTYLTRNGCCVSYALYGERRRKRCIETDGGKELEREK